MNHISRVIQDTLMDAALVCDVRAKCDPQQPTSSLACDLHLKVRLGYVS